MRPDISLATKSGHFYLLTTLTNGRSLDRNAQILHRDAQICDALHSAATASSHDFVSSIRAELRPELLNESIVLIPL
jgi:hypothetical protein